MNDFTASNGIIVAFVGSSQRWTVDPMADGGEHANVTEAQMQALREFFRAEADERLGRWRWPENPDYVVYPCSVKTRVRVLRESGTGDLEWVDQGDGRSYEFVHAARAYFDAHPEPKPWDQAKPGDVWEFSYARAGSDEFGLPMERTFVGLFVLSDGGWRTVARKRSFLDESLVRSARPVWSPEVSS